MIEGTRGNTRWKGNQGHGLGERQTDMTNIKNRRKGGKQISYNILKILLKDKCLQMLLFPSITFTEYFLFPCEL